MSLFAQLDTIDFNEGWRMNIDTTIKYSRSTKVPKVLREYVTEGFREDEDWYKNLGSDGGSPMMAPSYFKTFSIDSVHRAKKITLVFEGLDTYADIKLNGKLILQADNAFRTWRIDISEFLELENNLSVRFYPVLKKGKEILDTLSYKLPAGNDQWKKYQVSPIVRKPAYHFGWDWGPSVVAMNTGIFKPVYLLIGDEDESIKEIRHKRKVELVREYEYAGRDGNFVRGLKKKLKFKSDPIGRSFYFKIDGVPTFMRGANYIPMSMVPSALKDEDYRQLLLDVKESNINMLRVWGGGIYENDIFYELCDSLGIWVWQDFMFANMLPAHDHMTENIRMEVRDQVRRLSKYPCIIHWNGNNELDVAWKNWGWQKQMGYSVEDSTKLKKYYDFIFKEVVPEELHKILPEASYTHSSPLSNWGTPENFNYGSMHYWGVFHGTDSFEDYKINVGRFNSEYGFQSLPSWRIVKEWTDFEGYLRERQKSYKGMKPLEDAMKRYYKMPSNSKEYVYLSQLVQAYGVGQAIEAHRMAGVGRCGGTLYWQLNDVWPGISWSGIGHRGEWKALQYKVRELYRPLTFLPDNQTGALIRLINDDGEKLEGDVHIEFRKFNGELVAQTDSDLVALLSADRNKTTWGVQDFFFHEFGDLNNQYIDMRYESRKDTVHMVHFIVKPNELQLDESDLKMSFEKIDEGIKVICSATTLIKDVWFYTDEKGKWLNNYFDVLPNEKKEIVFRTEASLEEFKKSFEHLCLNEVLKE